MTSHATLEYIEARDGQRQCAADGLLRAVKALDGGDHETSLCESLIAIGRLLYLRETGIINVPARRCPATLRHVPLYSTQVHGLQCRYQAGHDGQHAGYDGPSTGDVMWDTP